jgi:glycosyltransferase involved in cell wall biosynthesis
MRILLITHSPLSAEFGAGQMAINLGEALKAQGHEVVLWSPHPLPSGIRWWKSLPLIRRKLDEFVRTQPAFDIIDIPAAFVTRHVSRSAFVVARSVQPDILYLIEELKSGGEWSVRGVIRVFDRYLYTLFHSILVLLGWSRAKLILCLGSAELAWMKRMFPWWEDKLLLYFNALSRKDQLALDAIREQRLKSSWGVLHFLWIGRWASHKGVDDLIDFIERWSMLRPQDKFTIAGCGNQAEKDCPPELIRSGKLRVLPSFKRDDLYTLLAAHNVGLFTSRVEGWGLALNEMLESGMPVFSTKAGGALDLKEYFENGLNPFPPTLQSIRTLSQPSALNGYYQVFTWEQIGRSYLTSILGKHSRQEVILRPELKERA